MFANIQTAIQDLQLGKMVIIVDDEERERKEKNGNIMKSRNRTI